MVKKIIIFFLLQILIANIIQSQETNYAFEVPAKTIINEYIQFLNYVGNCDNFGNDRKQYMNKIINDLFVSPESKVFNDLNELGGHSSISPYLGAILTPDQIERVYCQINTNEIHFDSIRYDGKNEKYLIKVAVKKQSTLINKADGSRYETSNWLKFIITFDKVQYEEVQIFQELKIISIKKIDGNKEFDNDNDGIIDEFDECPNKKGKICTYGCPDPDNDCLSDAEELRTSYGDAFYDRCPDSFGIKINFGCPDFDGDGVVNIDDSCYSVKQGEFGCYGCPDSDNDKVIDKHDKCPKVPGRICAYGCPDKDLDCVADKDDLYPDICGEVKFQGVPDGDGDGFADNIDICPCQPGQINGCPNKPYTMGQKNINIGIGITGLAVAGLGGWQKIESINIYNNSYNQPIPNNVAQAYYDDANAKHHNFIILTGLGTLGIGYALYSNRIKNKVDINNKSKDCTPLFPSKPRIDFTPNGISIICEF